MDKYTNKYRKSTKAQWWDYAWDGSYFITVCTRDREHLLGYVREEKMKLSAAGMIADLCWREIIEHAKNIELGPHVVMPNHVHGILTLKGNTEPFRYVQPMELSVDNIPDYDPDLFPMTVGRMRFRNPGRNSISTIIGGYKSAVTKHARNHGIHFGWQSRFHDHIIRDAEEYQRIAGYIRNNPRNWKSDSFY